MRRKWIWRFATSGQRFFGFQVLHLSFHFVNAFVIHIPFAKNGKYDPAGEARMQQRAKNAGRLLPSGRFAQALASQVLARQFFLVHAGVSRAYGLADDFSVHALGLEVGNDAPLPELLSVLTIRSVGCRVVWVV